jgi:flagellar biosynthesis chaperone FliJ
MNLPIQDVIREAEETPTPPSILHDLHNAVNLIEEIKSTFESKIREQLKQLIDEKDDYKHKWQCVLQENADLSASLRESNRMNEALTQNHTVQSKHMGVFIGNLDRSVDQDAHSMKINTEETHHVSHREHSFIDRHDDWIVRSLPGTRTLSYDFLIWSSCTNLSCSGIIGATVTVAFTLRLLFRQI